MSLFSTDVFASLSSDVPSITSNGPAIQEQRIFDHARVHNGNSYHYNLGPSTGLDKGTVLSWLSPLSFHQAHERIQQEAVVRDQPKEVGTWLLKSSAFKAWEARDPKCRKLWYLGMPGAGKSVLASIIVTHLLDRHLKSGAESPRVAYLYLSYMDSHTVDDLLGSVIKQIIPHDRPIPKPVMDLWARRSSGTESPTSSDLTNLFLDLTQEYVVYIIVDAMDEYPSEHRPRLLKHLVPNSDSLSILVTSRPLDEFDDISDGFTKENIAGNPTDLDLFMDHKLSTKGRWKEWVKTDPSLLDEVKLAISEVWGGMFLLASLQIKSLLAELKPNGVREKMGKLPKGIDDMYTETLGRIDKMESDKKNLAINVLSWVVFSRRSLTVKELQHALAYMPSQTDVKFDFEGCSYLVGDIRDVCGGLVTVADADGTATVSLVHFTAQDYFTTTATAKTRFKPDFHATIAEICIAYLSIRQLKEVYDSNFMSIGRQPTSFHIGPKWNWIITSHTLRTCIREIQKQFPFVSYAARHLQHHLWEIPTGAPSERSIIQQLAIFLHDRSNGQFIVEVEHGRRVRWGFSSLHGNNQSTKRVKSTTAMHLAIALGWLPMVKSLAKEPDPSSDIHVRDMLVLGNPLVLPTRVGRYDITEILLEDGAYGSDFMSWQGHAELLDIAWLGRQDIVHGIVSRFLNKSLSVQARTPNSTKLTGIVDSMSAWILSKRGVRDEPFIYLEEAPNQQGRIILSCHDQFKLSAFMNHMVLLEAAVRGDGETIYRMIENGKVNLRSGGSVFGTTALFLAIEFNHAGAVEALLAGGVDVNTRGPWDFTPLHRAAYRNLPAIVKVLLEKGADVTLERADDVLAVYNHDSMHSLLHGECGTPLADNWYRRGHKEVLALLLQAGVDGNAGTNGERALEFAAEDGNIDQLRLLLELGVKPTPRALQTAAYGRPFIFGIHNDHGSNLEECAYIKCIQALIEAGVDPNDKSTRDATPFDLALWYGDFELAQVLLEAGFKTTLQMITDQVAQVVCCENARSAKNNLEILLEEMKELKHVAPVRLRPSLQAEGRQIVGFVFSVLDEWPMNVPMPSDKFESLRDSLKNYRVLVDKSVREWEATFKLG
ncbi:hypothetical protein QBC46DRAFT_392848 [Diplogelasinospora grovesii]|uniref:NACHT domain-containing protein n=1 Tax=Diplogelasinospora grovesii TaxID=303347 RepID=A0AAN6N1C5_9PEZI|nr:hypothetical protein QBC46DRAFT_392848 [Diplogelasinospora grovesii]